MDATTYTGNGSTQTITNAGAFKPDLVWTKARSTAYSNVLYDSVRGTGTTKALFSEGTSTEGSNSTLVNLTSYNSNGWSVGSTSSTNILNDSGTTFVGWQWQANQGSTVSNTSGTITSTVSVNATAGFSVVTYTGNGTNGATIGHSLGVAPKMVIVKSRSSANDWAVYHSSFAANNMAFINTTGGEVAITSRDNGGVSSTSSTTFTTAQGGTSLNNVNGNTQTYVAYCWAAIAGYSAFGSYTGNGSADGPFVFTGFRPKFVMIKSIGGAGSNWNIFDTSRDTYNVEGQFLAANASSAEGTSATLDGLSNGFKIRTSGAYANTSAESFIYMAFAENPFKNANAR